MHFYILLMFYLACVSEKMLTFAPEIQKVGIAQLVRVSP